MQMTSALGRLNKRTEIPVFTEGTTINGRLHIPRGNAPAKLHTWRRQGAEIAYLTSRTKRDEIEIVNHLLDQHNFPRGELFYRREGEKYKDVAERDMPDLLIEDDCASIGGEVEMTILTSSSN